MANEIVRPVELPPRANPVASEIIASDNGSVVGGVTWTDGVNAGRPLASQGEAEAGSNPTKAMTPLTTKQAVNAQVPGLITAAINDLNLGTASQQPIEAFATAAQGALADTAVQPGDLADVATSGDYNDLDNLPTLGSAASSDVEDFATAEQGALADIAAVKVADRTALKALDGAKTPAAIIYAEGGRNGTFVWYAGNLSSFVTSDPGEGIYIATSSDPTGASGAWVRQHDEEILAIWFGVVADDSTDNTTTLQRAINFCSTHLWARFLRLPPGVCRTSTLTIQQHITVEGTGFLRTVLRFTNITGDCIKLDHGSTTLTGLALRNFRVDAVTQKTDGWALIQTCNDGAAIYFLELENLLFTDNLFHGWSLQSCFFSEINRVNISKIGVAAIGIRLKGASLTRRVVEITLNNCGVNNGSGGASIGLLIDSYTEGVWLNRVALEKRDIGYAMRIDNSLYPADSDAADSVKNIFGSQVCCDRSGFSCLRIDGGRTIHFSNSWFSSALTNHGIDLVSGFDISFSDCDISNNAQNGVRIRPNATDVIFNSCGIHANSVSSAGVYSGIDVDVGAGRFTVTNCQFHRLPGSTKKQKHAVRVQGGASDRYIIVNNRDGGSLDATSYLDNGSGTDKIVGPNLN